MHTQTLLSKPSASFFRITEAENQLRLSFLAVDSSAEFGHGLKLDPADLIRRSATLLEAMVVVACHFEYVTEETESGRTPSLRQAFLRVSALTHLDVRRVVHEAKAAFPQPESTARAGLSLSAIVRSVRGLLAICPIQELEDLAKDVALEKVGHRCRVAYDGLQSFVLRTDPHRRSAFRALGQAYTSGALDARSIASILDADASDVSAELEACGYVRTLETMLLDDADRDDRLAQARFRRLARSEGEARYATSLARRDMIASERLENIDARGFF